MHTLSWLGILKKPQQYAMDLHVMVTCPVLLSLTCFMTFMSYLVIFIFVFGIFGRMNSRIIWHIKGARDPSKYEEDQARSNQAWSKQAGMDRTHSTHRTHKTNRLNTRSLGYLCEHRLRNTNTHSKSTLHSIYSHSPQYISMKIEKPKKMPEQAESSTGKQRERSMEDTTTDRPMISALTLFPLPHQMGAPFFDGKDVSDFILQWQDLTMDWLDGSRIKKVPLYCEKIIGKYVKTLGTYICDNNWEGFVVELKSEFKDDDSEQQRNTEAFLQNMVQQMRQQQQDSLVSEYRSFIFEYAERSSLLVQKSVISTHTRVFMFLQAFSDMIGDKLCKRSNIDIDEPATTTNVWNTLKTEALKICTWEDSQMNKLWKSKMSEKALPRPEWKQPERKQKPEVVKKPESMDEITKMMKELQIRQLEAQKRMDEELALIRDAYKTQRPSPYYSPH